MNAQNRALVDYLLTFVTERKNNRINTVLANRTRHLTLVLEDIYQHHNASAIVRSCEIFGLQDLHVIEKRNKFNPAKGIALGSGQWIDVHHYKTTPACLGELKQRGYRIVVTMPDPQARSLFELPLDAKLALVFGTEEAGISPEALALADEFVTIPMYGFTESFNVSVSAALCMQHIVTQLHGSDIAWQLSEEEKLEIQYRWLKHIVRAADEIEKEFLMRNV